MMRPATILWAVLAVGAGTSLFMLKYEVQAQEQRLAGLRKDIVEAQESIHVLKAEWSYLNDPARLREQAERHLGLHPLKPSQIMTIASLPMRETPAADAPLAQGAPNDPLAAPVATVPPAPQVTRKTPVPPAAKTAPAPVLSKPARSLTAEKATPAPAAKTARAPAASPVKTASARATPAPAAPVKAPQPATATKALPAKPAPVARPAASPYYASAPVKPTGSETANGNVMVIKSPALAEPEVASTRAQP